MVGGAVAFASGAGAAAGELLVEEVSLLAGAPPPRWARRRWRICVCQLLSSSQGIKDGTLSASDMGVSAMLLDALLTYWDGGKFSVSVVVVRDAVARPGT